MRYFISDLHFNHKTITQWERTNFESIEEHDNHLKAFLIELAEKLTEQDELYVLGDWGNISFLPIMKIANFTSKTIFVAGNHDLLEDKPEFEKYFDEVYWHPIYLSERIIVSHFPQAIWNGQVNVYGHLHNSYIDAPGYLCASIHVNGYKPVIEKNIQNAFSKVGKLNTKFLYEPWSEKLDIKIMNPERTDIVCDGQNYLDVAGSRVMKKIQQANRKDN